MPRYEVVDATAEHAAELAENMREADVREIWAAARSTPLHALRMSLMVSAEPKAGLADGRVICMFGVGRTTMLSDKAVPWMLGSRDLPRHARVFLRVSREYVVQIMREHAILVNFVDARNTLAIRWLKWLGFTVEEARPFGPDQMPFHRFGVGL